MPAIETRRHGDILEIICDSPPVNALGAVVRQGLEAAIKAGVADASVTAMVVRCAGRTFFAGADISEFGTVMAEPQLPTLIDMIAASDKPVVAAIHGTALGGGLELAMGCHYRIAVPSAKLGLPEVKLGLLPGAGGTQRAPRLIGVAAALPLTVSGDPIGARQAIDIGLVDRAADETGLTDDAIAFAREIAGKRPIPRASERPLEADPAAIAAAREMLAKRGRGLEAPAAIVGLYEATAALPYAEGVGAERAAFERLAGGAQSAALRHIFFAERQAAKIDGLPRDVKLRSIERVGIIGAGTMGGGIAMNFLSAGIAVTIVETEQAALDRGVATIRGNYDATAAKGRLSPAAVDKAMALLTPTLDFAALADADLVIEAVYEDMDVKRAVFAKLDATAKPGAILATNTSYLDVDAIAAMTRRPEDVVGLHFFSPANIMKLLEVVRGDKTADDVLATAMALARRIGKVAVVAGVCHGFIGNRMLTPRQREASALLLEGATPDQVDQVHTGFGMPMGPFQMADLAGVDIGWHRDESRIESVSDALNAEGRWGQKKGAGYYDYNQRRRPAPSPRVTEIIARFREQAGTPQHDVTDREIVERTLYSMVNEGAELLSEGKAQRASDIDVVWVYGYGWPRQTGGPMYWADQEGLAKIVAGLQRHNLPVAPLLAEKAASGGRLSA